MNNSVVILLTGKAGVGKDTTADIIEKCLASINYKCLNKPYKRVAFANLLKQMVKDFMNGCIMHIPNDVWNNKDIVTNMNGIPIYPRKIFQQFGDIMKKVDPEFWIKSVVTPEDLQTYNLIITDCRYQNEANYFKNKAVIKIVRDVELGEVSTSSHSSEQQNIMCDYYIENNGSINELEYRVLDVLRSIDEKLSQHINHFSHIKYKLLKRTEPSNMSLNILYTLSDILSYTHDIKLIHSIERLVVEINDIIKKNYYKVLFVIAHPHIKGWIEIEALSVTSKWTYELKWYGKLRSNKIYVDNDQLENFMTNYFGVEQ